MRWSIQMAAGHGRVFGVAFELDGQPSNAETRGFGEAWVEGPGVVPQKITVDVLPEDLALMVRALQTWPMDLLDEMAKRDLADRRTDDTLDMEPSDD